MADQEQPPTRRRSIEAMWGTLDYYISRLASPNPPRHIDVCDAGLDDNDAIRLADALQGNGSGTTIKKLRLRGGRITSAGLLALAEAMGGVAGSTTALEELDLGHSVEIANDVDDFAFGMYLLLLAAGRLKRLDLEACCLGHDAGVALGDVIATHGESLESLNLRNNALEDDATICLAGKLGNCKRLNRVDLGLNFIGTQGASALADAIATNPPLQHLDLWGNVMEDEGAIEFARGLKTNDTLVELNLGYNGMSTEGLDSLLSAIFNVSSLNALRDSNHTLCYLFRGHCARDLLRRGCDVRTLYDVDNILRLNEMNTLMQRSSADLPEWTKDLPLSSMSIEQMKVVIYLSKCFDMKHFLEMDRRMVPQALEFVASHLGCDKVFELVGGWNMPQLFVPQGCS